MTEKMGYEKDKSFRRDYGVKSFRAKVGGIIYSFDSDGEYYVAVWLEYLRRKGRIRTWNREGMLYEFLESTHPKKYLPDFIVVEKDGTLVAVEYKTLLTLDHQAVKKLKRMALHYPSVKIDLVLDRITLGKGINKRASAAKYVRNVLDFSQIRRETKGEVKYIKPVKL